jgi:hypothetical protein
MIKTKVLFTVLALSASATTSAFLSEPYLLQVDGPSVVPSGCEGGTIEIPEAPVQVNIKPRHAAATLTYQVEPDSYGNWPEPCSFTLIQTPPQRVCEGLYQSVPDKKCVEVPPSDELQHWQCRINLDYVPSDVPANSPEYVATQIEFTMGSTGDAYVRCSVHMNPNVDPSDSGVCAGACHATPLQADTY